MVLQHIDVKELKTQIQDFEENTFSYYQILEIITVIIRQKRMIYECFCRLLETINLNDQSSSDFKKS